MKPGLKKDISGSSRMRIDNKDIHDADIFETIIDHFPDTIHAVDGEGNLVFANRKAEELLGYPLDTLLTMNVRQLYADEVLEALEKGFDSLKETGESAVESLLKDAHGKTIPVEIRSFGIYDDDGKFIRTFSILRDIRRVKELQQDLLRAGRLAAIGELASGIFHDISNPLAVITLILQSIKLDMEALEKQTGSSEEYQSLQEAMDDMAHASDSIKKLAVHLRNFARGVAEKTETIDLGKAVEEALFVTQSRIQKCGVTVHCDIPRGSHYTKGCANHIDQVFANLITNACDAMDGLPTRELTVTVTETTGERDGEPVAYWEFSIADTGTGIPQEIQEDIFHSFYSTKPADKGTGLGLAIVRGIVNDSKGEISLQSEEGKGTTFTVRVPKVPPVH